MSGLRSEILETSSGSRIAIREGGEGAHAVFAIGGMAPSPFGDTAIGKILEQTAGGDARVVLMDIAGSGASRAAADRFTMDVWLADVEDVFERRVGRPAIATGASIGAWLMLLVHRRHPDWFTAMCALAPALDWDQQYVGPALRDGKLSVIDGVVANADATLLASRELLVSMAAHHVLSEPFQLSAPMHVITGMRDEVAPAGAARRFMDSAHGESCTGEFLTDADHRVAKLDGPVATRCYEVWLRARLEEHPAASARFAPAGPRSAR